MLNPKRLALVLLLLCGCLGMGAGCRKKGGILPAHVTLYTAYGTGTTGKLYARVSKGPKDPAPEPGESTIQRVEETILALDARALHGAHVEVVVGTSAMQTKSDWRGYVELALPAKLPPAVPVEIRLKEPGYDAASVQTKLEVFGDEPGVAVVSDIDDTLLDSQVTDKAKMAANAIVRSTWELRTFPEAEKKLSAAAKQEPVFYLSGSPWGFHDRIGSFLARQGFPKGVLILKRFSSEPLLDQMAFKYPHLKEILDSLPKRRFLLFGDSGEKDPEIYARLRQEMPGRVERIFIHHITQEPADSPRFAGMTVFRKWSDLQL